MATIFRLEQDGPEQRVTRIAVPARAPLRLGRDGGVARRASVAASIVPHLRGGSRRAGFALVAWPGAPRVAVGARGVVGVAALQDRDHVFVGGCELLFSTDAVPARVGADASEACPLCLEPALAGAAAIHECPRCGLRACGGCWSRFAQARCPTAGCGQPAAFERTLWTPGASDFASAAEPAVDEALR